MIRLRCRIPGGFPLAVALVGVFTVGCATSARNQSFQNFAKAGSTYVDAVSTLIDETGRAAVDADSDVLLVVRENLSADRRLPELAAHDEALRQFLAVLEDLRAHGSLLKRYNAALAALAGSTAPADAGREATNLASALGKLSPRIKEAQIGEASIGAFLGQAVPLVVGQFRQKALEQELRRNGAAIERELALQQAALTALVEGLSGDFSTSQKERGRIEVQRPFAGDTKIPADWKKTRRELLVTTPALTAARSAQDAAGSLRQAFLALTRGEGGTAELQAVFADLEALITLLELIDGQKGK